MSFLVDTNVMSELRKAKRCNPHVATWRTTVDPDELYVSVLAFGEIRKGIERVRGRDPAQAMVLEAWLALIETTMRSLPIDPAVADVWGRIKAIRSVETVDAMLAATAIVHDLTFVTRNKRDVAGLGVRVFDPFVG
jgi:predicted nucleic acid-binding protein